MHIKKQTPQNNKTFLSLKRVKKTKANMNPSTDASKKNPIDLFKAPQTTCSSYLRALFRVTSVGKKSKKSSNFSPKAIST